MDTFSIPFFSDPYFSIPFRYSGFCGSFSRYYFDTFFLAWYFSDTFFILFRYLFDTFPIPFPNVSKVRSFWAHCATLSHAFSNSSVSGRRLLSCIRRAWVLCTTLCLVGPVTPPVSSWLLLPPSGPSWLLLAPRGSSWLLMAPPGSRRLLLAPPGSSWLLPAPRLFLVLGLTSKTHEIILFVSPATKLAMAWYFMSVRCIQNDMIGPVHCGVSDVVSCSGQWHLLLSLPDFMALAIIAWWHLNRW